MEEMRRLIPVVLAVAGCLMVTRQCYAQVPATGDTATGENKPAVPAQSSANPFPEDTSDVPVMPSKATPDLPEGTYNGAENATLPLPDEDMDPVRSPDDPAPVSSSTADSSSSLTGLERLLPRPEDDQPRKKRKLVVKERVHQEASSEDLEVGGYYLQTKNWKAALSRFESALVLDPENPEVYWGLAEAERHLGKFTDARMHYMKLLEYDPDGPHGKQARKELKNAAIANAQNAKPNTSTPSEVSK